MLFTAFLIISCAFAASASAHGLVATINLDGVDYQGYPAYNRANNPQRIVREMDTNGPITDVTSPSLVCNGPGQNLPAALVANVTAGSTVTYTWDQWPDSHKGPITNYMASCGEDGCTKFDATKGKWFKIDETGYDASTKTWASDTLIKNKLKYSSKIPQNIPSGQYLIRHEILALHKHNHPQYYPSCAQVQVLDGAGSYPTDNVVFFPGAYNPSDPGYSFNIFKPFTSYPIEGPPVFDSTSPPTNGTSTTATSASTASNRGPTSTTKSSGTSVSTTSSPSTSTSTRVCRPPSDALVQRRKRTETSRSRRRHEALQGRRSSRD